MALRLLASGRRARSGGGMNKIETAWAQMLAIDPQVETWRYEPISLRLAKNTFYRPDFLVVMIDGAIEIHEVKGHWEDDARVKIKVAAETYPWFVFKAIRRPSVKKGWQIEEIPAPAEER